MSIFQQRVLGSDLVSETVKTYKVLDEIQIAVIETVYEINKKFSANHIPRRCPSAPRQLKFQRLSKKNVAIFADKIAIQEQKSGKKVPPRNMRFCKICQASCNGSKTFISHIDSCAHQILVENQKRSLRGTTCNKTFELHKHL